MPPPSPNRNEGLDVLRALAIFLVLLLHCTDVSSRYPAFFSAITSVGWVGVDLFFVLSGFLIGREVFAESRTGWRPLREFWIRRWFRTLPLYFAVLAFYALIKPAIGYPFINWHAGFLVFTQNYGKLNDFVQSWSLCIEEQFYFVLPLLVFLIGAARWPKFVWLIPLFASMAGRFLLYRSGAIGNGRGPTEIDYQLRFLTHLHLDGLALGLVLAGNFESWRNWPDRMKRALGLTGAALAFATPYLSTYFLNGLWSVFAFPLISLGFSFLLILFHSLEFPGWLTVVTSRVAIWSYGVYLWNVVVIRAVAKLNDPPGLLASALLVGASLTMAAVTYYGLERPFMKLRARTLRRCA